MFVFPSPAEGFPKVVLDAMAVALPVVATPSGELRSLASAGVLATTPARIEGLGAAINHLASDAATVRGLRDRGLAFAGHHTRAAEAKRLMARLRGDRPGLPWETPGADLTG